MQGNNRVFNRVFRRRVLGKMMDLDQVVLVFKDGLGQFVDQILIQVGVADEGVPDRSGVNRLVLPLVNIGRQGVTGIERILGGYLVDLRFGKGNDANGVGGGQVHD